MKKKILFVIPSLSAGGSEKSLVNLLTQINYSLYDVDLFLFNNTGIFLSSLPSEVNILDNGSNYKIFTRSLKDSFLGYIKKGQFNLAYCRIMFTLINRLTKNISLGEQYSWKYLSKAFEYLDNDYDVAIGYLEKSSIYFTIDKVRSKNKIGWIHTNYTTSGMNPKFDEKYFNKLNQIVTVSEECASSLNDNFFHLKEKIKVIYNIVSPKTINELSRTSIDETNLFDNSCVNLITVARLSYEKGIDIAIKTCKLLISKGLNIKWYVIGEGNEREKLELLIEEYKLFNNFFLLGNKQNPYPYIKLADIYIQPSRYEGKSIAIDEAKILQKPIIVTNFETAKDQISAGVNGLVVEMNEINLAVGIEKLIENDKLANTFLNNLSKEKLGTEGEINELYKIL
jgi:glycosyltransferase involved in cell wall biosynthesis